VIADRSHASRPHGGTSASSLPPPPRRAGSSALRKKPYPQRGEPGCPVSVVALVGGINRRDQARSRFAVQAHPRTRAGFWSRGTHDPLAGCAGCTNADSAKGWVFFIGQTYLPPIVTPGISNHDAPRHAVVRAWVPVRLW